MDRDRSSGDVASPALGRPDASANVDQTLEHGVEEGTMRSPGLPRVDVTQVCEADQSSGDISFYLPDMLSTHGDQGNQIVLQSGRGTPNPDILSFDMFDELQSIGDTVSCLQ